MEENIFSKLNAINVNDKTEKKNGLTYLSWAWAWGEVKKTYPDANYTIYENTLPNGYIVNYFTDGKTSYVKTGVTINGLEHIEELPVMDYRNKSILLDNMTSFDVNKAIQRSLTKALARHGLGLYIYAGEDLPEEEQKKEEDKKITKTQASVLEDSIKTNMFDVNGIAKDVLKRFGYKEIKDIEIKDYMKIVNEFRKIKGE